LHEIHAELDNTETDNSLFRLAQLADNLLHNIDKPLHGRGRIGFAAEQGDRHRGGRFDKLAVDNARTLEILQRARHDCNPNVGSH